MEYSKFGRWKRYLLICCMALTCLQGFSQSVELAARDVAWRFLQQKMGVSKRTLSDLQLIYSTDNGYVYAPVSQNGFVWVALDETEPVVCGYSTDACVTNAHLPKALECYIQRGLHVENQYIETVPVAPLLSSVWNQTEPFNGMCPYYKYDNGKVSSTRCKVGCVATATSEVMRYYNWPEALLDTLHGWSNTHYEIADVMPGTRIDWGNILDSYDGVYNEVEAQAVQELALYCGMACKMNYGVNASGSNTYKLLSPLERVFGYQYVTFYDRSCYSPGRWRDLLQYELRRGVPLVYAGYNINFSGHAFVVDGLDDSGFYHIRWGEGGAFNGYFNIDFMNAYEPSGKPTELGREMGHFCNQSILAFHPDSLSVFPGDTLTYVPTDVSVKDVYFTRVPDTNGYVTVDVTLMNHSSDTITYTMLAFTAPDLEKVCWDEAEAAGITAVTLYPNVETNARVHCKFDREGTFLFGLTADEEHVTYRKTINVEKGAGVSLSFPSLRVLNMTSDVVSFELLIKNQSETQYASDMLTYCLGKKDEERYESQWRLLTLSSQESVADTVRFDGLQPNTTYVLLVRYPWTVVQRCEFLTPELASVGEVETADHYYKVYNLQGVCLMSDVLHDRVYDEISRLPKGIYILSGDGGRRYKILNK